MKEKIQSINPIFYNILKAIIIMVYFFSISIAYEGTELEQLERYIQVFSGIFMAVGIVFLEISYKKDESRKLLTSVEFLFLSAYSLSIIYIIKKYGFDLQLYLITSSYIFAIYYTLKSIIIYTKEKKQILNSLSDIREIVKKEEPVKREATKKNKINKEEKSKIDERKKKKRTNKKEEKRGKNND